MKNLVKHFMVLVMIACASGAVYNMACIFFPPNTEFTQEELIHAEQWWEEAHPEIKIMERMRHKQDSLQDVVDSFVNITSSNTPN